MLQRTEVSRMVRRYLVPMVRSDQAASKATVEGMESKKAMKRYLRHFDDADLILAAERYYMGRRSIHAAWFNKCLQRAWPEISELIRNVMRQDLARAQHDGRDVANWEWICDGDRVASLPKGGRPSAARRPAPSHLDYKGKKR